jgi:hypothetical protein
VSTHDGRPAAGRRERSAKQSLLAIVLGLEAALMFFAAMVALGLGTVPASVALGGGAALFVVLLLAIWTLRFAWGGWLGWVLQAVVIATGAVITLMYFIGAGFAVLWIYCFITGVRLDRRNAAIRTTPKESS